MVGILIIAGAGMALLHVQMIETSFAARSGHL